MTLLPTSSYHSVDRASTCCLESHWFDPCQGLGYLSLSHAYIMLTNSPFTFHCQAQNSPSRLFPAPYANFGRLIRMSSEIFGCVDLSLRKTWHSQDKSLMPITQKMLAGIYRSQGCPPNTGLTVACTR